MAQKARRTSCESAWATARFVGQHPELAAAVTEQLVALQHPPPDHALLSVDFSVHWLPAGPPHVINPLQALAPHVTVVLADVHATPPEHVVLVQLTSPRRLEISGPYVADSQ